jgi:hypothetical protein
MSLQLKRNDLARLRQPGQDPSKRGANPRECAVEQHQRLTLAVDLIIHVQSVDRSIARCRLSVHQDFLVRDEMSCLSFERETILWQSLAEFTQRVWTHAM